VLRRPISHSLIFSDLCPKLTHSSGVRENDPLPNRSQRPPLPLNRVVKSGKLTLPQQTVSPPFLNTAIVRTVSDRVGLCRFDALYDADRSNFRRLDSTLQRASSKRVSDLLSVPSVVNTAARKL
jgi:hypothetical protein